MVAHGGGARDVRVSIAVNGRGQESEARLLARSATGQAITAYSTVYTGPIAGRELHLVLVDNGRSRLLADPRLREACESDQPGICSDGEQLCHVGVLVCVPRFTPEEEICNGLDDDCDNEIDEQCAAPPS